ncbi:glycerophosphodiester phosphodiesterase [Virgibacillus sp. 179-BFC.A HS]|uniref:Glycerophosphodiester phosphodiesterase n=1 Tax=Tigheibacillus jepli TaxID=3035914 RepID=A0ABU5CGE8_9BACI|nr:glycerophosphodiester phosphodiesterase [Virgibacillus sp. 179-BFC.A HS]MDY0404620.1 glycerophosphodiester phosphodiesterase [Virgibacillus sp. 179-BFC.A HS]
MKKKQHFLLWMCVFVMSMYGCSGAPVSKMKNAPQDESAHVHANKPEEDLLSPDRFLNIAHRGASGYAPEHTLKAYEIAEKMQGDYIEIDLQMTKDGKLIAMHDDTVSRTTNSKGKVSDFSFSEVEALDAGTWFNEENPGLAQPAFNQLEVPSLEQILDAFGTNANYYIETKKPEENPTMVDELLTVLKRRDLLDADVPTGKVIIQSFSKKSLLEVQQKAPSLPRIQLMKFNGKATLTDKELANIKQYAVGIGPNASSLTKAFVQQARKAGLLIHPYTVNEKADMKRLIDWGVTGMFTNYPDRLNEVLGR